MSRRFAGWKLFHPKLISFFFREEESAVNLKTIVSSKKRMILFWWTFGRACYRIKSLFRPMNIILFFEKRKIKTTLKFNSKRRRDYCLAKK
jgi:hypothetical protein